MCAMKISNKDLHCPQLSNVSATDLGTLMAIVFETARLFIDVSLIFHILNFMPFLQCGKTMN